MSKKFLNLVFIFSMLVVFHGQVLADSENKDSPDGVFTEHNPSDFLTQVLLGFVDFAGYKGLGRIKPVELKLFAEAQGDLDFARALPTSSARKAEVLKDMRSRKSYLEEFPEEDLTFEQRIDLRNVDKNIQRIETSPIVSMRERRQALVKAEEALSEARTQLLLTNGKFGNRTVKFAIAAGRAVLIVDLLGRVYVWYGLNAEPTLTPVGTFLFHYGNKPIAAISTNQAKIVTDSPGHSDQRHSDQPSATAGPAQ